MESALNGEFKDFMYDSLTAGVGQEAASPVPNWTAVCDATDVKYRKRVMVRFHIR
jgi:hypothetical protein